MKGGGLRPATHAAMLGFVLLTPVLGKWGMAATAFSAFLLNLLVLPRTAFGRTLAREGEGRWNGLVAYPLAVALGYALFEPELASIAWAVMALGDPAATIVGRMRPWKARVPWNRGKSLAGSAAFVLAGAAGALGVVVLVFMDWGIYRLEVGPSIRGSLAIGAFGALLESLPWPKDDNLPVLLGVAGAITLLGSAL